MNKPFAPACERNRQPILEKLQPALTSAKTVLEVGSGTGQHAVYFAEHLPHVQWQTSDLPVNHAGIHAWLAEAALENLIPPIELDVAGKWPENRRYDAIYTANTLHIMSWEHVQAFIEQIPHALEAGGLFCVYGPFNYNGSYTSESNAEFDLWLKERDPASAIRDFEAVNSLLQEAGLSLISDSAMPANNRFVMWKCL